MSGLTDDQLDGLFRKSAEAFQPPFDSAAWQDMNARLDANDRLPPTGGVARVKQNILRWGLPLLLLLLLGAGGWSVYQSDKLAAPVGKQSLAHKPGVTVAVPDKRERSGAANRLNDKEGLNVNSIRTPDRATAVNGPVAGLEVVTPVRSTFEPSTQVTSSGVMTKGVVPGKGSSVKPGKPKESEHKASLSVTGPVKERVSRSPLDKLPANKWLVLTANGQKATSHRIRTRSRQASHSFNERWPKDAAVSYFSARQSRTYLLTVRQTPDPQRGTSEVAEMPFGRTVKDEKESPERADERTAIALPALRTLAILPAKWTQPLRFSSRSVAAEANPESTKMASQPASVRGLSVRFTLAPDLSSVGLKNFSRPGTNLGLLLEYRLASRWSIQAGLIQSTKVYQALTSEYEVPAGWWKAPMEMPERIDGRCTMFDIPINIRYDVVIKPRLDGQLPTRWFASGGVTSYIMKNEEYYYSYLAPTNNQLTEYDVSTGGYGFSNLNLSVGYERAISRRLSWQVEPFMKVPLKGVGNFNVRLLSTGTFFSLRYKL